MSTTSTSTGPYSGVRVSGSFQKNADLLRRLGSGHRLVADVLLADIVDVVFTSTRKLMFFFADKWVFLQCHLTLS